MEETEDLGNRPDYDLTGTVLYFITRDVFANVRLGVNPRIHDPLGGEVWSSLNGIMRDSPS